MIYITDEKKKEAINKELGEKDGQELKSIEIANIFKQGTKFTDPFNLYYQDEKGEKRSILMGGYGIGVTRLMGTIVEVLSDEKGLIWPEAVAPFQVHLLSLSDKAKSFADEVYESLTKQGIECLYDDRDARAGEKFADADLIGIPTRVVIGDKALESKMLEVKERNSEDAKMMTLEHLINELSKS